MNEDVPIEKSLVSAISHAENWARLNRKLFKPPDCSRSRAVVGAVFLVEIQCWFLVRFCEVTARTGPQPSNSILTLP